MKRNEETMQAGKTNRILWIDELKGFMLILICLGHIEYNIDCILPLASFFFISGYLFRGCNQSNFVDYLVRKTKSLLLPYFIFSFVFPCARLDVVHTFQFIFTHWNEYSLYFLAKVFVFDYINACSIDIIPVLQGRSTLGTASLCIGSHCCSISSVY